MIRVKLPDALGEFFIGHRIRRQRPAKAGFIDRYRLYRFRRGCWKLSCDLPVPLAQFLDQFWRNGQPVAASKRENLVNGAERGRHDDGVDPVGLEVSVDTAHRQHAGVFVRWVGVAPVGLLVLVGNPPHEG